ncbi:restriction endonuclease subunit S [Acinetobacter calcoaceticus]
MSQLPRYESYKDSGVQWLGEIPSHWAVVRLDQGCEIVRGNTGFSKADLLEEGQYLALQYGRTYKVDEINNTFSSYVNEEFYKLSQIAMYGDTVLISTSETIEDLGHSCFYARQDIGLIGGEQFLLKVNQKEKLGKYLYYLSKAFSSYLRKYATGTKVYRFNTDHLKKIYIPRIPFNEQKVIADFLDKRLAQVDALIAKQKILLEKLAEQRVALISHTVTKGLNPDVEMKESGVEWLGKVPKSWDIANLRYFISCNSGDALESSRILRDADEFNNIPVIGGNGLLGFTENSNYKKECIAVGRVGALCGNVHFIDYESWINDNALLIKLISDKFNINYLVYLLRSRNLNELASKTAQPLLTGTQVKAEKVCIPLMSEQLEIVRYLDTNLETLDKLLETVNKTIQTLREYRSTLITQVVTGKIDVRNLKVN